MADRPKVSDLRGEEAPTRGSAVLEDPTGRRRRMLRIAARSIAIVLTLWLIALVLGAAGLSPVPGIPLSHALRPASAPPTVKRLPPEKPPSAADRRPAAPAASPVVKPVVAPHSRAVTPSPPPTTHRLGRISPRRVTTPPLAQPRGQAAPPAAKPAPTTHGNAGGRGTRRTTTTTTTGTTTTPTTGGRSGSAPGIDGTAPGRAKASTTPAAAG